jgi:excinuclease ABC subunit C
MIDLESIPKDPGCYLFRDSRDNVIYVGKAKSLVKRVKSYFIGEHDVKTNVLVSHIKSIDFVVTDSEVEALILENNLIKKYKPRYNIDLKDSKRYAFIEVTGEEFPRLLVARKKTRGSRFYGPFVSGMSRDYILNAMRKVFKIRTCKRLPKRRCMRFDIGLCSGPCIEKISRKDYLEDVKSCEMVLKGKTKEVVGILERRMKAFSLDEEFERALEIREQIRSIKELSERQKMERNKAYDEDFINWIVHDGTHKSVLSRKGTKVPSSSSRVSLILFNARKGILENKQSFEFDYNDNFLEEFLVQFYSDYDCPKEIVLPEDVDSGLKDFFKKLGARVVVPKKGDRLKLLELVKRNVEIAVFGDSDKVRDLAEKLNLNFLPKVIECFDVSHLSGTDTVASMVQFRDGKADKNNYRRFKIRTVEGNDDYASMREVVLRRYTKLKGEDLEMPDLILIDGGKGQLGIVVDVLKELDLKIAVIGIAKREEEVFFPGRSESVRLDRKSKALRLLQEIRDEAHRFAINYQRLLRGKRLRV